VNWSALLWHITIRVIVDETILQFCWFVAAVRSLDGCVL